MQVLKGILKDSLEYYERLKRELKARIARLPKGSVKKRRIKGHTYYYLQVRDRDKIVHRYLGRQEPRELMESVRRRRLLVKELTKVRQALRLLPMRKPGLFFAPPAADKIALDKKSREYIISNMANRVNLIQVERAIRKGGLRLFSPLELERILGVSAIAARFLVHRYAKHGIFLKLRKGLYCLADQPPSELAIANRLYEPSYLSFEFALSYHHLIPEAAYVITSATSRPTRTLTAMGKTFEYHRLKRSVFTGYEPIKVDAQTILIATPEKAVVDTLYFVDLKKKTLNDRLKLRSLNRKRIESYLRLFRRPSLRELVRSLQ